MKTHLLNGLSLTNYQRTVRNLFSFDENRSHQHNDLNNVDFSMQK